MKLKSCPFILYLVLMSVSALFAAPSKFSPRSYFATPAEGITTFNSLYTGGFVDLTGAANRADGSGLLAANVAGYNFRLFANNSAADFGIGIEPFTGQTAIVYGYTQSGLGFTTTLDISSNDGKIFDLQSVDITVDKDGTTPPAMVQLTGYRNGSPVSGAVLSLPVTMASAGGPLVTFTTNSNPAFEGIDMFRITGGNLGAIGVDNINALRFRDLSTVPLRLLDFKGHLANHQAILSWKSDNEVNTKNFEIERSVTGNHYSIAGTVDALNTSGIHQYTFTDNQLAALAAPVLYYRLKQNDLDGTFTYSSVLTLRADVSNRVKIYPNPVQAQTRVFITLSQSEDVQVNIITNSGQLVSSKRYRPKKGTTSLPLDVQLLAQGIYHIEVKGASITHTEKLIKQY